MAYSNYSQLRMLSSDEPGAIEWGMHAVELAEALDEVEILVHALNNLGTSELRHRCGRRVGRSSSAASRSRWSTTSRSTWRGRTRTSRSTTLDLADYAARRSRTSPRGSSTARERDLDAWVIYMTGHLARSHMNQGRWDEAVASAQEVLADPRESSPSRVWPLLVIGRRAGAPRRPGPVAATRRGA